MSKVGDSFLEWTLAFEPDEDAEEDSVSGSNGSLTSKNVGSGPI
jgi:hypothetical protein